MDPRHVGWPGMSRARVIGPQELRHLLAHIARRRHALRNATQLLLTYRAGLRVGEVAAMTYGDVVDGQRRIRMELQVPQGAGKAPRTALLSVRMRRQLAIYVNAYPPTTTAQPLFYTQKRAGWTANTLAQHFFHLYRAAGLDGASSQSGRRTFVTTRARRRASAKRATTERPHPLRQTTESP